MDTILGGLNSAQREAVETLEGPLLILAGAGSGKTKTLTHRIANLIAHGVQPSNILAVTFTNKAAKEMRNRLWDLLQGVSGHGPLRPVVTGESPSFSVVTSERSRELLVANPSDPPRSFMPYMGTFHGIAVRILRIEADAAGLDKNFVIYDTDDQVSLIKRILKSLKLSDNKNLKPKSIQAIISSEKNQGNGPEEYAAGAFYPNQQNIAKVFRHYEEEKAKAGALDFDDLLLKELELFQKNLSVRKKWQEKFRHILIDEYQDTNMVQYSIVKLLVNERKNICVVGDDWQSIYSWRGADFTNILNFERDYPGAKVIKLEQNYRSTGNILAASQKIINENKTRTDKTLFTETGKGEPVEIESLRDETEEANYVALKIMSMQRQYPDFSDFAVLYRTNAQSYTFEKAFINMHIPYKIVGGVRFYDRKEVKDVLAILKLLVSGRDKVSLERVVKNVLSGVGEASLAKILMAIDALPDAEPLKNSDLLEVLGAAKAKNGFMRLVNFMKKVSLDENPGEIVKKVIEYFDFKTLTDDGTPSSEERMGNLEVLASNAAVYDNLEDFLADASLMSSADESSVKNSVTLMTLHAAKGLEFPVVFMVGMEDGLFPSGRATDNEEDLEEERRLAYVGMTRAMRKLFLTYAASRYSYGNRNYNMPSRFLTELGYNPYGSSGYKDNDGDGFNDFTEDDFDPFPEDVPVFE
ncbi:ATP-dependent helicase [Candidatus Nanosyncoccus alces]|uniref:DNA 3'-5' helicase n=1 Tax=Candidatus Nanosyncoccus alces TaxID=2171997 RepID=A0ABY0FMH4_9BACT|nr:UvrD-helicase domain-containing protein [Candidatus Nanosyncoccus alces]RYC75107.1 ATP-dependent DNA helicase PcrA [Candidatus Nanosyncoccus alces]